MKYFWILLLVLLYSCSNGEDDQISEETIIPNVAINVIAAPPTSSEIIELAITSNGGGVITSNLTSTLGIPPETNKTNSRNDLLTWYNRNGNHLEIWQKNAVSGASQYFETVCNFPGEFPVMVANSESRLFIGTQFVDAAGTHSRIRIFDGSSCITQTFLNFRIRNVFELQNEVLIYCTNNAEDNVQKIVKMDLQSGAVVDELPLANSSKIAVDGNVMHVFSFNSNYNTYQVDSFNFITNATFDLNYDDIPAGFVETEFDNNLMYIKVSYAQPSVIANGPALVDLVSGDIETPYYLLFSMVSNLNKESDLFFEPTGTYDIDINRRLVVAGYTDGTNHGVVLSNFNAEILEVIPLEHFPLEVYLH